MGSGADCVPGRYIIKRHSQPFRSYRPNFFIDACFCIRLSLELGLSGARVLQKTLEDRKREGGVLLDVCPAHHGLRLASSTASVYDHPMVNIHPCANNLAAVLIAHANPAEIAQAVLACEEQGQPWVGWVLEHLTMGKGKWRNEVLDTLEPMMRGSRHPLTRTQAAPLVEMALQDPDEPDLVILCALKRLGHPAGSTPQEATRCADLLAQGVWLPPEAIRDRIFHNPSGEASHYLEHLIEKMLQSDERGHNIDPLHLQRIDRTGMLGTPEVVRPLVCKFLALRCRHFIDWEDFLGENDLEDALPWMVQRDWVRPGPVREALATAPMAHPKSNVDEPFLEMLERECARALQARMQQDTVAPQERGVASGTPRF